MDGENRGFGFLFGNVAGLKPRFGYVAPKVNDISESMKRSTLERIAAPAGLNEKTAAEEAFSTFSLHVSDVSFKLAFAALGRGEWPEAAKIRIEEFVNAFDYGDPMPGKDEKVACSRRTVDSSVCPAAEPAARLDANGSCGSCQHYATAIDVSAGQLRLDGTNRSSANRSPSLCSAGSATDTDRSGHADQLCSPTATAGRQGEWCRMRESSSN